MKKLLAILVLGLLGCNVEDSKITYLICGLIDSKDNTFKKVYKFDGKDIFFAVNDEATVFMKFPKKDAKITEDQFILNEALQVTTINRNTKHIIRDSDHYPKQIGKCNIEEKKF